MRMKPGSLRAEGVGAEQKVLQSIKTAAGGPKAETILTVGSPARAVLRPVATRRNRLSRADIRALTEWRNRYVTSFLTEFQATEARTTQWLVNVVGPKPNKILFMVDDLDGRTFGYMGLDFIDWVTHSCEVDAVVRGDYAPKGTMAKALTELITWARKTLGLANVYVRVRSDNSALSFYRRIGFEEVCRIPLVRCETSGEVCWKADEKAPLGTPCLVRMRYAG